MHTKQNVNITTNHKHRILFVIVECTIKRLYVINTDHYTVQLTLDTPGQAKNVHCHSCCRLDHNEGVIYCCDMATFGQPSQWYHDSLIQVSNM